MDFKRKLIAGAIAISLISLAGCSSKKPEPEKFSEKKYVIEEPREKEIHDAIVKAASNAEKSLQILASVNNAEKADKLDYDKIRQARWRTTYTPVGMERTMTISNWEGPVAPVLSQIKKLTGYEFKTLTPEPINGVFVSLNFQNEKIINVIRSIEAQLHDQININIYEDDKIVEVRYVQ